MIIEYTNKDRETRDLVNEILGKPFSLLERVRMKGIGSRRMLVEGASNDLMSCFGKSSDLKYASIELRPKGIIVYIKNTFNEFIWLVPFFQLSVFQGKTLNLHANGSRMDFNLQSAFPANKAFVNKMLAKKTALHSQFARVDDLS